MSANGQNNAFGKLLYFHGFEGGNQESMCIFWAFFVVVEMSLAIGRSILQGLV